MDKWDSEVLSEDKMKIDTMKIELCLVSGQGSYGWLIITVIGYEYVSIEHSPHNWVEIWVYMEDAWVV